jgi:hypothetical protein
VVRDKLCKKKCHPWQNLLSNFKFFGCVGPIHQISATPEREAKKPRLAKSSAGFLLLSSINRDILLFRFEQFGQKIEKKKMKKEERRIREGPCLPAQGSIQVLVLRLGLLQDGDVGVGVFPEGKGVLIATARAYELCH